MSSIEKIAIQGMRSFGPDERDKQLLTFFTPLTLILGANGTGKTTIIECLKYITTGDMPPNSGRGGSFVFDPQLANEIEVKGQVRLQLKDVTNKTVCVTRSLMLTQKKKKVELKTIDGTLQRKMEDGQKVSLSSRCADLNKEMMTCLGVTKPILNNVIFCHQEESTWPLCEGKALKQKFDDIFAATRYIKALENIRKTRQELAGAQKVHAGEMKYLQQNKDQANRVMKKLSETENFLLVSKDKMKQIRENLRPLEEKLNFIASKEREIGKLTLEIGQKRTQCSEIEKSTVELRNNIQNFFDGDSDRLIQVIQEFKQKMLRNSSNITQLEQEIIKKSREIDKIVGEKSKLLLQIGKLKTEDQQHKERVKSRDKKISVLCGEYNIELPIQSQDTLTENEVNEIVNMLNRELGSFEDESERTKIKFESDEAVVQSKIDNFRDSKTKLEHSIKTKTEQMNSNKMEVRKLDHELVMIQSSATRKDLVDSELKKAEQELREAESSLNANTVRSEIETLKKRRTELDSNLRKLDAEMQRMHLQSSTQAELDHLRSDKTSKSDLIKKLLNKHEETLIQLLGRVPTENIRYEVDKYKQQLSDDIKTVNKKCEGLKMQLSSAESKRQMLKKQLNDKENELKSHEEKIFDICGSENFDGGLEVLQKSIKEMNDENGALIGTRFVYTKFLDKLESKRPPCCPLCHRDFDDDQDVIELVNELNSKMRLIPSQLDNKAKTISAQQRKFNSMLELKPIKNQMESLRIKDVPELKSSVKELNEQIEQFKIEIDQLEDIKDVKQVDDSTIASIQGDMVSIDQAQIDSRKIDKKIAVLEKKLIGNDKNRTLRQVGEEKENLQKEADKVKHDLEGRQERLSDYNELVQSNRDKVNGLRNEKLTIETQLQRQIQLKEKRTELIASEEECKTVIQKAREQIKPLETKMAASKEERDAIILSKEKRLRDIQTRIEALRTKIRDLNRMQKDVERYIQNGGEEILITSEQELKDLEKTLHNKDEERVRINNRLDQLRKEVTTQQVRERELSDNLQLRQREQQLNEIRTQLTKLEESLGGYDTQSLLRDKQSHVTQIEKLTREKNVAEGRQRELETNVTSLKADLQSDVCKDADEKYKHKLIELRTTEIVGLDLHQYYNALDRAIMKHHTMKMAEINEIIRELWRNTYRGNDIDFIEIRSDEEEAPMKANMRRVYHYRVVMVKGEVTMDMRGRCSAGQKVLASIIIRLALAETFGLHCGVLALDEPTTNLDRENIDSLAEALIEIVKSRSRQANFQLVIITHDEEFLERLGRSEFVDHYYKIEKNYKGLSTIKKFSTSTVPL